MIALARLSQVSIPSRRGKGSDRSRLAGSDSSKLRLNPLKAGQRFGRLRVEAAPKEALSLNPLKAGQRFGPILVYHADTGEFVSIPSRRGKGSDRQEHARLARTTPSQSPQGGAKVRTRCLSNFCNEFLSLNPLKAGQRFGHWVLYRQGKQVKQSQSPQGGAKVRTEINAVIMNRCAQSLNPLKAGQRFGPNPSKCSLTAWSSLNPLKAGQRFGRSAGQNLLNLCFSLNPLKAGQRFGPQKSLLMSFTLWVSIPSRRGKGSDR